MKLAERARLLREATLSLERKAAVMEYLMARLDEAAAEVAQEQERVRAILAHTTDEPSN